MKLRGLEFKTIQKTWMVILTIIIFLNAIDGIRVYENTNIEGHKGKQRKSDLTKKSLYLSKRSWNSDETVKSSIKTDRRSDGKWKEFAKGKHYQNEFPTLYKIVFKERNFNQYVKYIKEVPRLEEYTLCLWYKTSDLSHHHTLFTYLVNKNEKLLRFWIDSTDSTLRMAVRENVVYTVPANIRRNKWHHICQSWHGVAGEWQVFLDGKRIGAGVLPLFKETYIPEGEVILGQQLVGGKQKQQSEDKLDGELFGFNLVDEAVTGEQADFINSQYKPSVRPRVPPFKKLPPIKKTYQEIRAYITRLPSNPTEFENGLEMKSHSEELRKRQKGNRRTHYTPMRRVVVYNREDRKLSPSQNPIEKEFDGSKEDSTKDNLPVEGGSHQPYDENYSIHSYRMGKDDRKSSNYEIYENLEEDPIDQRNSTGQKFNAEDRRGSFDLFTAREVNKVYTLLAKSVRGKRKPKFHFESGPIRAVPRKSQAANETESSEVTKPEVAMEKRKSTDSIPVYEAEVNLFRQKRSPGDSLAESFRRLPQIPDSFINIFTKNASKTEMEQELSQFFPENATNDNNSDVASSTSELTETETTTTTAKQILTPEVISRIQVAETPREDPPPIYQVPPVRVLPFGQTLRVAEADFLAPNSTAVPNEIREFDPRQRITEGNSGNLGSQRSPGTTADRRNFYLGSGADLVMAGYDSCTSDRGSPIREKDHLVISWAETPIRIFGGGEIENARNECGNF